MEKFISFMLFAIIAAVLSLFFKGQTDYIGIVITIICGIFVLLYAFEIVGQLFSQVKTILSMGKLDVYGSERLIKVVGISIVTRITSEICRDASSSGLAAKVEMLGIAMGVYVIIPLFLEVLRLINNMI